MKKLFIFILLFSPLAIAKGEYPSKMEGAYYIWGDPIDKNNNPGIDGFTVFLEGEAAERIYKKIEEKPHHNECWDDGTLTKYAGNIECSLSPKHGYSCAFAIGVNDQKIYKAETC